MTLVATSTLEVSIRAALDAQPGLTARELANALRVRGGHGWVTRHDVNRVLYASPAFHSDRAYVPRWDSVGRVAGRPARSQETHRASARLAEVDALLERLTQTGGSPDLDAVSAPSVTPVSPRTDHPDGAVVWGSSWCLVGLRRWQQDALTAWIAAGARGVVEAVTGTGKTHLGIEAALRMARAGGVTTILVPSVELQQQWMRSFAEHAPSLRPAAVGGLSQGDAGQADVIVALVQTACRRDPVRPGRPRLLVGDETHRYGSEQWSAALRDTYRYRLGLTATLERDGDDGVEAHLRPFSGPRCSPTTKSRPCRRAWWPGSP